MTIEVVVDSTHTSQPGALIRGCASGIVVSISTDREPITIPFVALVSTGPPFGAIGCGLTGISESIFRRGCSGDFRSGIALREPITMLESSAGIGNGNAEANWGLRRSALVCLVRVWE